MSAVLNDNEEILYSKSQLKNMLNELVDTMMKLIDEFNFVMDHHEMHLYDQISKLKNEIDIHREELIQQINRISNEMLKKVDIYFNDCKYNFDLNVNFLKRKNKIDLAQLKENVTRKLKSIDNDMNNNDNNIIESPDSDNSAEDVNKIKKIIEEIQSSFIKNRTQMNHFESNLFMNKKLVFESIYNESGKDFFGELLVKDNSYEPNEETCKKVKTFGISCDKLITMELLPQNKLAVGDQKGKIKIYNLNRTNIENFVHILCAHSDLVTKMVSYRSKSISYLISGSIDGEIILWDLDKKLLIQKLTGHNDEIRDLCLTNNYSHLISSSWDERIFVWDMTSYQIVTILCEHSMSVEFLRINSLGKLISYSADRKFKIWDLKKNVCEKTFEIGSEKVKSIELTSNDNMLIHHHLSVKLLHHSTGVCLRSFKPFKQNRSYYHFYVKMFTDDLFITASTCSDLLDKFTLKIWHLNDGTCIFKTRGIGVLRDLKVLKNHNIVCLKERMKQNFETSELLILNMN